MANNPKKIFGLVGYPVRHSLSPAMHDAAFRHLKIDAEYRLFEVRPEELEGFLENLDKENIFGLNVTIPYKIRAREILEKKFPFDQKAVWVNIDLYYVRFTGAVNTVKREGSVLKYWNTDADGFLKSLEADLKFVTKNKTVLLIGCGGAGRAVIAALSWINVGIKKIFITDINLDAVNSAKEHFFFKIPQAKYLPNKLEFISPGDVAKVIKDCDLLVNATPIGMKEGDGSVIGKNLLHDKLYVYDLVYNCDTQLIKDAQSLKRPAIGGLRMLWRQGILSFEHWTTEETKEKAPQEVMWEALQEALAKCQR
ncbi:MAG: shikimate dehydrogenase [Candidatus Omnitrophota bacterium]